MGPFPSDGLAYPKTTERPPFRTRAEIEAEIRRGTTDDEAAELWRSLFLTLPEVDEVLGLIRDWPGPAWLLPAAMLAAHTGARRSEIIRARVGDFDLVGGTALIREKKRARGRLTTRRVPVSPALGRVLARWSGPDHPGGTWAIASAAPPPRSRIKQNGPSPVTVGASNHYLRAVLAGTRWAMIGWHTFRHSFASNCAACGVDERIIDAWMGHQTEAMRRRYRHLLPDRVSEAIRRVFPEVPLKSSRSSGFK